MIIDCPYCGERYSNEFSYEGDATLTRPDPSNTTSEDWYQYVYARKNDIEAHKELWLHLSGCRQHIVVTRNLRTHQIIKVQSLDAPKKDEETL